jgi:ABC-type branched-subunit amino acid transport system substrate-binding protein
MRDAFTKSIQTVPQLASPAITGTTLGTLAGWSRQPPVLRWGLPGLLAALLLVACGFWLFRPRSSAAPITGTATAVAQLLAATATFAPLPPTVSLLPTAPAAIAPPPSQPTTAATQAPAPTGVPSVAAPPTQAPAATEPAAPTEAPGLEPPTPLPAAAPNTIRIGLQSPQTGEWGALGTGIRHGAELAAEQQKKSLADLGYNVEFVPYDDRSNPAQGRANAQTIVADPAVLCVVGHFNSGVTLAAQPIYAAASLVQISPGSTNPQVTDSNDNVWRVVGRDDVQGRVAATYARDELKSQRAYVIDDNTAYGRGIATVFQQDAQANGPQVVGFKSYEDTLQEIDWAPFLDDIQTTNPDVIYFAGSYSRAGVFFKLARERGYKGQFLGSDSLDNAELASLAGDAVAGMHFTTVAAPISAFPKAGQFAKDYQARYGQPAPPFSPESYDATAICVQAVAQAARAVGGRLPTRQQVLDAMRSLPRYQGISGNYSFNQNGDPQSVAYFVVEVNVQDWSANKVIKELLVRP